MRDLRIGRMDLIGTDDSMLTYGFVTFADRAADHQWHMGVAKCGTPALLMLQRVRR